MSRATKSVLKAGVTSLFVLTATGWMGAGHSFEAAAQSTSAALSTSQVAAIQALVQTQLANVNPNLTGDAKTSAVKAALATAMTQALQTYGSGAIAVVASAAISNGVPTPTVVSAILPVASGSVGVSTAVAQVTAGAVAGGGSATTVAESVIAVSTLQNYAAGDVGSGLGAAAAQIGSTNMAAASDIGTVVSNEGASGMGSSFSTAVLQNGGSQQLASSGTQNPTATAQTGGNVEGGGQNGSNNTGSNVPSCANPSCT